MKIFGFLITVFSFIIFYKNKKQKLLSKVPIIFSAGLFIIIILEIFNISYERYYQSSCILSYLIAPATLAFSYPLYKNSNILTKNKRALYSALCTGTLIAVLSTYLCASIFDTQISIILSMLPKSTTMPIAIEISKNVGGILELTACVVVITGITGAIFGHWILKTFSVKNDIAIGLAMGSASHVIGTAACAERNKSKQVAAGTIALILVGFLSAILIPLVSYIIQKS